MPRNFCWRRSATKKMHQQRHFCFPIENSIDVIYQNVRIKVSIFTSIEKYHGHRGCSVGGRMHQTMKLTPGFTIRTAPTA
jgi:hypothetical protein